MTASPASQLVSNVISTVLFPTTESRAVEPATPVWKYGVTAASPIPSSPTFECARSRTPPPQRFMPDTPAKKGKRPTSLQGSPKPEAGTSSQQQQEPPWLHATYGGGDASAGKSGGGGNVVRRGVTPNRNGFSTLRHVSGSYNISAHQEITSSGQAAPPGSGEYLSGNNNSIADGGLSSLSSERNRSVPRLDGVAFASRVPRPDAVVAYAEQTLLPSTISPRPSGAGYGAEGNSDLSAASGASPRPGYRIVHSRTSSSTSDATPSVPPSLNAFGVAVQGRALLGPSAGSGLNSRCTTAPPTPGMGPQVAPIAIPMYAFHDDDDGPLFSSDESPKGAAGQSPQGGDVATLSKPRIFHRSHGGPRKSGAGYEFADDSPQPPRVAAVSSTPFLGASEPKPSSKIYSALDFSNCADDADDDDFIIRRADSSPCDGAGAMALAYTSSSIEDRHDQRGGADGGQQTARSVGPQEDYLIEEEEEMEIGDRFSRQRFQFRHYIPWTGETDYIPLHLDINGTCWLAVSTIDGLPYAVKEIPRRRIHGLAHELQCLTIGNEASNEIQNRAADFIQRYYTIWKDTNVRSQWNHQRQAPLEHMFDGEDESTAPSASRRPAAPHGLHSDDDYNHDDDEDDVFVMQLEYYPRGNVQELWLQPSSDVSDDLPTSPSMLHYEMPTEEDVRCCIRQALLGLSALHHHGFVHGNPIPYNIFAAAQNHFKLGSLGSAERIPGFSGLGDRGRAMVGHVMFPSAVSGRDVGDDQKVLALFSSCPEQYLPLAGSCYVTAFSPPDAASSRYSDSSSSMSNTTIMTACDVDVFILFASMAHLLLECADKAIHGRRKRSSSSFSSSWSCFPSTDDVAAAPFASFSGLAKHLAPFYSTSLIELFQRVLFLQSPANFFASPRHLEPPSSLSPTDQLVLELDAPSRRIYLMQNALETQITFLLERIELAKKKKREQLQLQQHQAVRGRDVPQHAGGVAQDPYYLDKRHVVGGVDFGIGRLDLNERDEEWVQQVKRGHETPDDEGMGPRRASSVLTFEPIAQARRTEHDMEQQPLIGAAAFAQAGPGSGVGVGEGDAAANTSMRRRPSGLSFALPPPLVIDVLADSSTRNDDKLDIAVMSSTCRYEDSVNRQQEKFGRRPSMFLSSVSTPLMGSTKASPTFPMMTYSQQQQEGQPSQPSAGSCSPPSQQVRGVVPRNGFASYCANVAAAPNSFRALLECSSPVAVPSPPTRRIPAATVSGEDLTMVGHAAWSATALFPPSPPKQLCTEPPTPAFADLSRAACSPPLSQLSSSVGHGTGANATILSGTSGSSGGGAACGGGFNASQLLSSSSLNWTATKAPPLQTTTCSSSEVGKVLRFGDDDDDEDIRPPPPLIDHRSTSSSHGNPNISVEVVDRVEVTAKIAAAGSVTLKSTVDAVEQLLRLRLGNGIAAELAPLTTTR